MAKGSASAHGASEQSAAARGRSVSDAALAGGFKAVANALKPMSKKGTISMAQARKVVRDYVRASSK